MENGNGPKQDRRKTSPIRGGKGRPKPGAGRRVDRADETKSPEANNTRGVRGLFFDFENAAEKRIRVVIEEEMAQAEERILRRLTGRRENRKDKEAA